MSTGMQSRQRSMMPRRRWRDRPLMWRFGLQCESAGKAIGDLRRRIAATRWPDKATVNDRTQGILLAKLTQLVRPLR